MGLRKMACLGNGCDWSLHRPQTCEPRVALGGQALITDLQKTDTFHPLSDESQKIIHIPG